MACNRTAWPRAPPLTSFDYFYRTFLLSVNLNLSPFIIDPNLPLTCIIDITKFIEK